MYSLFELGNKYKHCFYVQYDSTLFTATFYSKAQNTYIVDYCDGNYQQLKTINGFVQIKHNSSNQQNKLYIKYDNYDILGINLRDNHINKIILQEMKHLQSLDISNNDLTMLILNNCGKLYSVNANNNKISYVDLNNNSNLKYLDLSNNEISQLDLTNNKKLQQLSISHNKLSEFSKIKLPNSIKNLNIVNNQLDKFEVNKQSLIQYLNISDNQSISSININSSIIKKLVCFHINESKIKNNVNKNLQILT